MLSASFSDLEIREALETLDARGFKNTIDNRRNLALDLQQEVIDCNGAIIKDFGHVAAQLQRVGQALDKLKSSCAQIRRHIDAANRETKLVLDEAKDLLTQKTDIEQKQALLSAFQCHFIISDDDVSVLSSGSTPVNDAFFQTVTKVKRINQESRLLLGGTNEKLGLDILEQSSKQLNLAYQKLYRWIQAEFKTLDLENPQIGVTMRRAIRVLADRPQLFQSWMDSFAESREHILIDAFNGALVGIESSLGNAIDSQAHDPLRYIGDLLAWAHSATVSEREALEVLFIAEGEELAKGLKAGLESDPFSRSRSQDDTTDEVFDGRKALSNLVSRDIAGVGRNLRQKTEQVLSGHDDATQAYKVANLIAFYRRTFERLLTADATFLELLDKLQTFALQQFRANMRDHVASIQSELRYVPSDAAPPEFLEEALATLRILMQSYDSSMSTAQDKAEEFEPILQEALDPFLNACQTALKQLAPPKRDIFALNCLMTAKGVLAPFGFTAERVKIVNGIIERHTDALIEAQVDYMVESAGIDPLLAAITKAELEDPSTASAEDLTRLAGLPIFSSASLASISQELDDFLPSALIDARDHIRGLRNAVISRKITEAAAERFCDDFAKIEDVLSAIDEANVRDLSKADENGIDEGPTLRTQFPRTSEEVRVLLS